MKFKHWLLIVAVMLVLSACKKNEETIDEVNEPVDTEETVVQDLPNQFPLTGMKTAEDVSMRPIAVTINNHPSARPQSGITSADIVYEMLVEGDATRLLAIYQSELPENLGPIRSAREYFVDIANLYDAYYIAHGYSPVALDMLKSGMVDYINGIQYDGTYFKRFSHRKAPHNSYISADSLKESAKKLEISLENEKKFDLAFYEEADNVKMGSEANVVEINYYGKNSPYSSIYTYDADSKVYLKASPQGPIVDELDEKQVAISNVLFFESKHETVDNAGRKTISLTSGGNAYLFQQGQMREVQWKNENGFIYAIEEDGSKVQLVPGKTWIQFVPTSPGLSVSVTYTE